MKLFVLPLLLIASATAAFLVPAWGPADARLVESKAQQLTPALQSHTLMVGRLGLPEVRPAVVITADGHLLASYLAPISAADEAPYLLYQADGSRTPLELIEEKTARGTVLLKAPSLPLGITPAPLAPDNSILSCHWFLTPAIAPVPSIGEPVSFTVDHLFPQPKADATSFILHENLSPPGTPVFDLAGRLVALTTPGRNGENRALLLSRLAEDLKPLADLLPDPSPGDLPRLARSPSLEKSDSQKDDKEPESPLAQACSTFAESLLPNDQPFALIFNEGQAITHAVSAVIVDPNGLLLTKASDLGSHLTARHAGRAYPAVLLATDEETDLALVGIPATGLPVIQWASPDSLTPGSTLISPLLLQEHSGEMMGSTATATGQFSHLLSGDTPTLHSASDTTSLGIVTEQSANSLRIASLRPDAPKTDLQPGDQLLSLNNTPTPDRPTLVKLLAPMSVGDEVTLTIQRGDEQKTIPVTLTRPLLAPPLTGIDLGGELTLVPSVRRYNFPQVIVHTTPLNAWDCGSPLYNLAGQPIALNIAAASPHRTLALPPSVIQAALTRLSSQSESF